MEHHLIFFLAAIPTIGVLAQWIAIRFNLPAILILLLSGFIVGPLLNILHPDQVLGDVLNPFVSLSVALILFEGGLSLKFSDIRHTGKTVRNMIIIGTIVSVTSITASAYYLFNFNLQICILLGTILLVSGPTVIAPMLRQIKLKHDLSSILRWEGIIIDPIGATLAVLVYEIILVERASEAIGVGFVIITVTLLTGIVFGILGGVIIMFLFKKHLVPEFLQESFTFIIVILFYAVSDMIQPESGLLVVTVMGIFLANQKLVMINHIVTFKENISVLLISSLFILLAARIDLASFQAALQLKSILFIMSLIFIIRPLSIFLSTIGSSLAIQEKFFLSFMYPRGIVAAAISSIFSIRLSSFGVQDAEQIIPLTFIAIVFTVTFYGLIGKFLVSLLGLNRRQKGLFIVGAHQWARTFATILRDNKITVILVDTNLENILLARKENLDCIHGSILSKRIMDDIEISGFGKLLALTSSDETNLLSTIEYKEIFGSKNVFMLSPKDKKKDIFENSNSGKLAFNKGITFTYIESLLIAGATFQLTEITEQLPFEEFLNKTPRAIHLCYLSETTRIHIFSDDHTLKPKIGSTVISIIPD